MPKKAEQTLLQPLTLTALRDRDCWLCHNDLSAFTSMSYSMKLVSASICTAPAYDRQCWYLLPFARLPKKA